MSKAGRLCCAVFCWHQKHFTWCTLVFSIKILTQQQPHMTCVLHCRIQDLNLVHSSEEFICTANVVHSVHSERQILQNDFQAHNPAWCRPSSNTISTEEGIFLHYSPIFRSKCDGAYACNAYIICGYNGAASSFMNQWWHNNNLIINPTAHPKSLF